MQCLMDRICTNLIPLYLPLIRPLLGSCSLYIVDFAYFCFGLGYRLQQSISYLDVLRIQYNDYYSNLMNSRIGGNWVTLQSR